MSPALVETPVSKIADLSSVQALVLHGEKDLRIVCSISRHQELVDGDTNREHSGNTTPPSTKSNRTSNNHSFYRSLRLRLALLPSLSQRRHISQGAVDIRARIRGCSRRRGLRSLRF